MRLIMLGTGNALVTKCYNTCFLLEEGESYFLVDGGGGNTILRQLQKAEVDYRMVQHIFVTHKHVDHIMGIIWLLRVIGQAMQKEEIKKDVYIYSHAEVLHMLTEIAQMLLQEKQTKWIGKRIHFIEITDGERRSILGHEVIFFDIQSTKAKQYGFTMQMSEGEKLTCCGDEPYRPCEFAYAQGSKWLLHEAFCLYEQAEQFKPYEKNHSTVKDACELAARLGVKNVVLYHTEDQNLEKRKQLYEAEGKRFFDGGIYVPEDLESIEL